MTFFIPPTYATPTVVTHTPSTFVCVRLCACMCACMRACVRACACMQVVKTYSISHKCSSNATVVERDTLLHVFLSFHSSFLLDFFTSKCCSLSLSLSHIHHTHTHIYSHKDTQTLKQEFKVLKEPKRCIKWQAQHQTSNSIFINLFIFCCCHKKAANDNIDLDL